MNNKNKHFSDGPQKLFEGELGATGAWSFDSGTEISEPVDHLLQRRRVSSLGRAAYHLTHPRYWWEVRARARDLMKDMQGDTIQKQILPPRSRDFGTIGERRHHTAQFALDIAQMIHRVRRFRLALGGSSTTVAKSEHLSHLLAIPPVLAVVETEHPPLDGEQLSDSDFIPYIVTNQGM